MRTRYNVVRVAVVAGALDGVLTGALTGDPVVLLGDFKVHVGNSETLRGAVDGMASFIRVVFCFWISVFVRICPYVHASGCPSVHVAHVNMLRQRLMIDFLVVLSDL